MTPYSDDKSIKQDTTPFILYHCDVAVTANSGRQNIVKTTFALPEHRLPHGGSWGEQGTEDLLWGPRAWRGRPSCQQQPCRGRPS